MHLWWDLCADGVSEVQDEEGVPSSNLTMLLSSSSLLLATDGIR
jgi:hypothetical protein